MWLEERGGRAGDEVVVDGEGRAVNAGDETGGVGARGVTAGDARGVMDGEEWVEEDEEKSVVNNAGACNECDSAACEVA